MHNTSNFCIGCTCEDHPCSRYIYTQKPLCYAKKAAPEIKNPFSTQVGGDHYTAGDGQDPAEFCLRHDLGFAEGNAIKYIFRHRKKGKLEDLRKAKHYLEMLAFVEYGENL